MRLNRFYTPRLNLRVGSSIKLEDSDVKHVRKVLRLSKGDNILIFNGEKEFTAELKIVGPETVMADIIKVTKEVDFSSEMKTEITLFQCLLRAGKFDFIIEKVTELGVNNIIPVEAEFSQTRIEIADKKIERWNKVAVAASKQSERITIPQILKPIKFNDIEYLIKNYDLFLLFTIPKEKNEIIKKVESLKSSLSNSRLKLKSIAFMIGPEGGFSSTEHTLANNLGLKFVKITDTILRSETAAISATTLVNFIYNSK